MSKLAKGLVVGTLAAGIAALAGVSPVSASAMHDYDKPSWGGWGHHGSYSDNSVSFHENYDKASKFFYSLKQDEKKDHNEHFSYDSKNHDGWNWGGHGNSVKIKAHKSDSSYKLFEEEKYAKERESYNAKYKQDNKRVDHGGWGHGVYAHNSVRASVDFNKEYEQAASVKAVAKHSSSADSTVHLANYGPHGGQSSHISAYENSDNYSKVEASYKDSVKKQASESYSADNVYANLGGWHGGSYAANSVDYKANNSYEASREVKYLAEEKSSYSSGFNADSSSYNKGYHHDD